jgi:hypothetical protein
VSTTRVGQSRTTHRGHGESFDHGKRVPVIGTIDDSDTTTSGVTCDHSQGSFNAESIERTGARCREEVEVERVADPDR